MKFLLKNTKTTKERHCGLVMLPDFGNTWSFPGLTFPLEKHFRGATYGIFVTNAGEIGGTSSFNQIALLTPGVLSQETTLIKT